MLENLLAKCGVLQNRDKLSTANQKHSIFGNQLCNDHFRNKTHTNTDIVLLKVDEGFKNYSYLAYSGCACSAHGSPSISDTFHVCLNDIVYLAATNAAQNEPIMGIFSYFFPKLNNYKGNVKFFWTHTNTWLEIAGLGSTKNKLFSVQFHS